MEAPRSWEDEVAAFLRGDPSQLAAVQTAVQWTVRSFRFGDTDLERDLVQETLSRVLASLLARQFQGDASLKTYARNVARYTCLHHIRRRRQEVAADPDLYPTTERWSGPETSYLSEEEHRRNLEAFAALPAECRDILRMICLEGASYREVAARLNVSETALKSRIHRCRLTCREAAKRASRRPRLIVPRDVL